MKKILTGLLALVSVSSFSMDLEQFAESCPKQMKQLEQIEQRAEDHYNNGPASELKFAEGRVILASMRGFVTSAEDCREVENNIPEILMVMKKLKIK